MQIRPVDPRDQTHEVNDPAYRVFFWSRPPRSSADTMWRSEEWELSEVDVHDVLSWVSVQADGRLASVWVVVRDSEQVTHVRLAGIDPPAPSATWPKWAKPSGLPGGPANPASATD